MKSIWRFWEEGYRTQVYHTSKYLQIYIVSRCKRPEILETVVVLLVSKSLNNYRIMQWIFNLNELSKVKQLILYVQRIDPGLRKILFYILLGQPFWPVRLGYHSQPSGYYVSLETSLLVVKSKRCEIRARVLYSGIAWFCTCSFELFMHFIISRWPPSC